MNLSIQMSQSEPNSDASSCLEEQLLRFVKTLTVGARLQTLHCKEVAAYLGDLGPGNTLTVSKETKVISEISHTVHNHDCN